MTHPYFYTKVDLRSRSEMVGFLCNHDRYHTMSSWNQSRSFSNCVKVNTLRLPADVQDVMFEATQDESMYENISYVLENFADEYRHGSMIGHNGRSSGYLVLYNGCSEDLGYKSWCRRCHRYGKSKIPAAVEPLGLCPLCGANAMVNLHEPVLRHYCGASGYGEGWCEEEMMDKNYWDIDSLREEVKFIRDFDKACSDYVEAFVWWCREEFNQPSAVSA